MTRPDSVNHITVPRGGLIVPLELNPRGVTAVWMPTAPTSIHATRSDADGSALGDCDFRADGPGWEGD
jgi:hypothetical protein